jgi:hypothetical protein
MQVGKTYGHLAGGFAVEATQHGGAARLVEWPLDCSSVRSVTSKRETGYIKLLGAPRLTGSDGSSHYRDAMRFSGVNA